MIVKIITTDIAEAGASRKREPQRLGIQPRQGGITASSGLARAIISLHEKIYIRTVITRNFGLPVSFR